MWTGLIEKCMLVINTPKQKKEEAIKIIDPVSADNLVIWELYLIHNKMCRRQSKHFPLF